MKPFLAVPFPNQSFQAKRMGLGQKPSERAVEELWGRCCSSGIGGVSWPGMSPAPWGVLQQGWGGFRRVQHHPGAAECSGEAARASVLGPGMATGWRSHPKVLGGEGQPGCLSFEAAESSTGDFPRAAVPRTRALGHFPGPPAALEQGETSYDPSRVMKVVGLISRMLISPTHGAKLAVPTAAGPSSPTRCLRRSAAVFSGEVPPCTHSH